MKKSEAIGIEPIYSNRGIEGYKFNRNIKNKPVLKKIVEYKLANG